MTERNKIIEFIDTLSALLPGYILSQLKKKESLELISQVIESSGKLLGESVIVMISIIKYLWNTRNAFAELEASDAFIDFIQRNRQSIVRLASRNRVQANIPERALPMFEIFDKELKNSPIAVIELGASYGLVGQCLLEPEKLIQNKRLYFSEDQKIPLRSSAITHYLGIELSPPEKEWIFSCFWQPEQDARLRNFTRDIPRPENKFELLTGSVFGFSNLPAVQRLIQRPVTVVVLISFLFFQLEENQRSQLKSEVLQFTQESGSHWINQGIHYDSETNKPLFFLEWNGERIIELKDERCSDWWWLRQPPIV
jgi:hypothetical protein